MPGPDIIARLRLNAEHFGKTWKGELGDMSRDAAIAGKKAGSAFTGAFGGGIAFGAGALGVGALFAASKRALDYASSLEEVSQQLGVSTNQLQEYRYAATQTGVSQDEMDKGLARLTRSIGQALDGNKAMVGTFREMNIGLVDGEGRARSTGEVFRLLADRLGAIEDPAKRARIETELFGKSGQKLDTLLSGGTRRIDELSRAADQLGVVMSRDEIQNADEAADKLADLRQVLEAKMAVTIGKNAEAIVQLANSIATMTGSLASWWAQNPGQAYTLMGAIAGGKVAGAPGAAVGALGGMTLALKDKADGGPEQRMTNTQITARLRELAAMRRQRALIGGGYSWGGEAAAGMDAEGRRLYEIAMARRTPKAVISTPRAAPEWDLPEVRTAERRTAPQRSAGGATDARRSEADAKRAARDAQEQLEARREIALALDESLASTQRAIDIDNLRTKGLENQARVLERQTEREEAIASMRERHKDILVPTTDELVKQLGFTKESAEAKKREADEAVRLAGAQTDARHAAEDAAAARRKSEEMAEEAARANREAMEDAFDRQRDQLVDLSDFYRDAFSGGTDNIWENFKDAGMDALADLAAQWTLSLIAGGQDGIAGMPSRAGNPLGRLLGSFGGGGGGGGSGGGLLGGLFGASGLFSGGSAASNPSVQRMLGNGATMSDAVSTAKAGGSLGGFGGILGTVGSALPYIGAATGVISLVSNLFKKTPYTSQRVSSAGDNPSGAAGEIITSVKDNLRGIAEQLGAQLNLAASDVVVGTYGGHYRVSTKGYSGKMKYADGAKGIQNTGDDAEATIRLAIKEMIADGVLTGISDASQRILRGAGDMDAAIEKAMMIEQVPKLLRERLDPLGAALDEIDAKFRNLAAALKEGGASADQVAEARKLWELERADAVKSIADASGSLKDYLKSLRIGSDSPLSLRAQQAEADAAFAPYLAQVRAAKDARGAVDALDAQRAAGQTVSQATYDAAVTAAKAAAAAVDQEGFAEASSVLLGLERQINGSTGAFFQRYDQIESLTRDAISLIEKAVPQAGAGNDPFGAAIAQATQATASIVDQRLKSIDGTMHAILAKMGNSGGDDAFTAAARNYVLQR